MSSDSDRGNLIYGKIFIKSKSLQCSLLSDQRFYHKDVQGIWFLPLWYDGHDDAQLIYRADAGLRNGGRHGCQCGGKRSPFYLRGVLREFWKPAKADLSFLCCGRLNANTAQTELKMLSELKRSHPKNGRRADCNRYSQVIRRN